MSSFLQAPCWLVLVGKVVPTMGRFLASALWSSILLILLFICAAFMAWGISMSFSFSFSSLYFPHSTEYSPATIKTEPRTLQNLKIKQPIKCHLRINIYYTFYFSTLNRTWIWFIFIIVYIYIYIILTFFEILNYQIKEVVHNCTSQLTF